MRNFSTGTIPAPGLLRSFCDRHNEYKQAAKTYSQMGPRSEFEESKPTYGRLYAAQPWLMPVHQSKRKFREKVVKKSYQYQSCWLNYVISLSYSVVTGAGGVSIAPALRVQGFRGEHSWAAQKLRMFNTFDHLLFPMFDGNLNDLAHQFHNAFSDRIAAPSEMVRYGGYTREPACSLVDVGQHNYLAKVLELILLVFHSRSWWTGTP